MLIKTNSKMSTSNNDNVKNTPFIDGFCKCRLQSLMLILFITLINHTTSWAQPGKSGDAGQKIGSIECVNLDVLNNASTTTYSNQTNTQKVINSL